MLSSPVWPGAALLERQGYSRPCGTCHWAVLTSALVRAHSQVRIKSFGVSHQRSPVTTNPQVTSGQSVSQKPYPAPGTPHPAVPTAGASGLPQRGEAEGREGRRHSQTLPPPSLQEDTQVGLPTGSCHHGTGPSALASTGGKV